MKPFITLPNWQCVDGNFHQIEGYRKTYSSEYRSLIQPAAYQWQDNHAEEVECDKPTVPVEALRHAKEVLNEVFNAILSQGITPPDKQNGWDGNHQENEPKYLEQRPGVLYAVMPVLYLGKGVAVAYHEGENSYTELE